MRRVVPLRVVVVLALVLAGAVSAAAQAPVAYKVTVPEPQHRWLQVEATFTDLGRAPLHLQMSRSSPGRYALHEFAKNLFEIKAYDSKGIELALLRLTPSEWSVSGHDGTVRVVYKLYGDRVDGTYLAVDTTHEHLNMPAAFLWARGLENRPIRVEFVPADPAWTVATQLFPTDDPRVFTAPNLQYFMDSPTEVGPGAMRTFTLANPDGRRFEFRVALHHDGTDADVNDFAAGVEKIMREEQAVYGEFPDYEPGSYTVIGDYLPYASGDGMEHRNSTIVSGRLSIDDPQQRLRALGTVAHEFFHCWNVEELVRHRVQDANPLLRIGERPARRHHRAVPVLHAVAVRPRQVAREERVGARARSAGTRRRRRPPAGRSCGRRRRRRRLRTRRPGCAGRSGMVRPPSVNVRMVNVPNSAGLSIRYCRLPAVNTRGSAVGMELRRHLPVGAGRHELHPHRPHLQPARPHERRRHVDVRVRRVDGQIRPVHAVAVQPIPHAHRAVVTRHAPLRRRQAQRRPAACRCRRTPGSSNTFFANSCRA